MLNDREIWLARMDKTRPVVILTRSTVLPYLRTVTVAVVTSTIRGVSTEVHVGPANGLDHQSVISLDNVQTIAKSMLLRRVGALLPEQEQALGDAIRIAFDLG